MRSKQPFNFIAMLSIVILPLWADDRADQRQENHAERIEQGVENGSLTKQEAEKLEKKQDKIENMEVKMRSDDSLSVREQKILDHRQDKASQQIYREKHDNQMPGEKALQESDKSQRERIREGVRSGELTPEETRDLRQDQREIRHAESRATDDGKITDEEATHIKHMKKKESRKIYRKKHNADKR